MPRLSVMYYRLVANPDMLAKGGEGLMQVGPPG
jgi:hypothetical protein